MVVLTLSWLPNSCASQRILCAIAWRGWRRWCGNFRSCNKRTECKVTFYHLSCECGLAQRLAQRVVYSLVSSIILCCVFLLNVIHLSVNVIQHSYYLHICRSKGVPKKCNSCILFSILPSPKILHVVASFRQSVSLSFNTYPDTI